MPRLITWVILVASSLSATAQSRPAVPPLPEEVAAVEAQEEILRPAELKYDTSAADPVWAEGFVLIAGSDGSVWNKEKFLSAGLKILNTWQRRNRDSASRHGVTLLEDQCLRRSPSLSVRFPNHIVTSGPYWTTVSAASIAGFFAA